MKHHTHASRLKRAGLPTIETLTRRILQTFDRATASDIESGAMWYAEAQALAIQLGETSGHGTERAACVLSHLSPRTPWARNVAGAIALLVDNRQGVGILSAKYSRAREALFQDRKSVG